MTKPATEAILSALKAARRAVGMAKASIPLNSNPSSLNAALEEVDQAILLLTPAPGPSTIHSYGPVREHPGQGVVCSCPLCVPGKYRY